MYRGIARHEISLKWIRAHINRPYDGALMYNLVMGLGLTIVYRDGQTQHDAQDPAVVKYVAMQLTNRLESTRANLVKTRNDASEMAAAAELAK